MGGFVKTYRVIIIIVLVAVTLNQVVFTFLVCLTCMPIAKQWDPSIPGHCIHTLGLYYVIAGRSSQYTNNSRS